MSPCPRLSPSITQAFLGSDEVGSNIMQSSWTRPNTFYISRQITWTWQGLPVDSQCWHGTSIIINISAAIARWNIHNHQHFGSKLPDAPWSHFTNSLWGLNSTLVKMPFALFLLLMMRLHHSFADTMTAQLWHVKYYLMWYVFVT